MATIDNSDSRRKLEDEIKKLEAVVTEAEKTVLPSVTLDRMTYVPPTDAQLAAEAEQKLAGYKRDGESAIRNNSEASAKELGDKRAAYETGLARDVSELESSYADAAARVDADVIKRGLARSSIAVNAKSGLEAEYLQKADAIREEYGKRITELDSEIAAVGTKLTAALNDFNLSYASKLNETLSGLKAERDEKAQAVLRYNNEIKAKQASLDAQKAKTESDLYSAAIKQSQDAASLDKLSSAQRDEIYKSVYDKINTYLASLSKEQARIEIRNYSMYRDHLSDYYYYKLYDRYGR